MSGGIAGLFPLLRSAAAAEIAKHFGNPDFGPERLPPPARADTAAPAARQTPGAAPSLPELPSLSTRPQGVFATGLTGLTPPRIVPSALPPSAVLQSLADGAAADSPVPAPKTEARGAVPSPPLSPSPSVPAGRMAEFVPKPATVAQTLPGSSAREAAPSGTVPSLSPETGAPAGTVARALGPAVSALKPGVAAPATGSLYVGPADAGRSDSAAPPQRTKTEPQGSTTSQAKLSAFAPADGTPSPGQAGRLDVPASDTPVLIGQDAAVEHSGTEEAPPLPTMVTVTRGTSPPLPVQTATVSLALPETATEVAPAGKEPDASSSAAAISTPGDTRGEGPPVRASAAGLAMVTTSAGPALPASPLAGVMTLDVLAPVLAEAMASGGFPLTVSGQGGTAASLVIFNAAMLPSWPPALRPDAPAQVENALRSGGATMAQMTPEEAAEYLAKMAAAFGFLLTVKKRLAKSLTEEKEMLLGLFSFLGVALDTLSKGLQMALDLTTEQREMLAELALVQSDDGRHPPNKGRQRLRL